MKTAGPPAPSGEQQRGTKGILSRAYFFLLFFSAEEQPLELPEQSKLRLEVTQKDRLFRHFPHYHHEKKFRHFPWVHCYDFSSCAPKMPLSKRRKEINFCFLHMFHSPRVASEVQFCFLFTSLLKLFLNFCSRYLLNTWDVRTSETPRTES